MERGMTLREPAVRWDHGLPCGNGTLGALVLGHIHQEQIVINHERLWLGTGKPHLPDVSEHLPRLRQLLREGRYAEAEGFLSERIRSAGGDLQSPAPYHPACDLRIHMADPPPFSHYRRALDFQTGVATVSWVAGGASWRRELFVSRTEDIIALRIVADRSAAVSCQLSLAPCLPEPGREHWRFHGRELTGVPLSVRAWSEDGCAFLLGRYDWGDEYGAVLRLFPTGGSAAQDDSCPWLGVEGADELLAVVGVFAHEPADRGLASLTERLASLEPDWDMLLQRHAAAHGEMMSRVTVDLGGGQARHLTNEELLAEAYEGQAPPALIERLHDYGRYLLICSSRPGGLPANLQGVWNGDYNPAWASDYHNDENIQMNYWQALPGDLPETLEPFFDYYESFLADYRANAARLFGCRGILIPIAQSTHGVAHPGAWLNWTAAAGWLAQHFYDYWLFTGDRQFLVDRAVPFMKEVAQFYEDFLVEDGHGGLMLSPSLSPENVPARPGASLAAINATMDVAVAREQLGNLCAACEELELEPASVRRWRGIIARLPEYEANTDGALREWLHPDLPDNYHHRHLSHLYPVFPGLEIMPETSPELFEACRIALEKRLVIGLSSQTGWSLAHMANLYARMGEPHRAHECLELLCRSCVGPNLFTSHNDWRAQGLTMYMGHGALPPFQIDANFGLTAAVLEMLVFSAPGLIRLLPAPAPGWRRGRVDGVRCRGGVRVSIRWDRDADELEATLSAARPCEVTVCVPQWAPEPRVEPPAASMGRSEYGAGYLRLRIDAGRQVKITAGPR